MSSAASWIEWSISGEASRARSVLPFTWSVASTIWLSRIAGLRSSLSSTSSVASSETWRPSPGEALGDGVSQLVGDLQVAPPDLDPHR